MIRLGVTGTDTGVGKTTVSRALLGLMRADGLRVSAMKPVETGVTVNDPASDARALAAAAGTGASMRDVCPVALDEPLAPWMAARRAGRTLAMNPLDESFHRLIRDVNAILVEGAGGLLVPITETDTYLTLFQRWSLDAIVVAANRLGVINHTRLTVQALRDAGVRLLGVVLNETDGAAPDVARRTNHDALQTLLPDTPVVSFPWLPSPADDSSVARAAAASGLRDVIARAAPERPHTEEGYPNR
ncbi:MAG TPA: dethiobiotin synthase [Gemmatimonadaceae bacterium]